MGIRSLLKGLIDMWPMYRQGERQCKYQQRIKDVNSMQLYYYMREKFMPNDVLKLQTEKGDLFFYLPDFPRNGTSMEIILTQDFSERELLDNVKQYITSDSVVADIGANIGNHTLYFSYYLSPAKILAFEPQKSIFQILQKNCELNNLQNKVELYNCCLGEKEAFANLEDVVMNNAGATSFAACDTPTDYKVITLDSLNLTRLDFIKIDVEGHELDVFKGAAETIKRCSPVIWSETLTRGHKKTLYRYLKSFGYTVQPLDDTNSLFLPK